MNIVVLLGRLAQEPELGMTQGGVPVCKFVVACDRKYTKGGERQADFIRCVSWRQTAEFIHKYFRKGQRIALEGAITTRSYDDDSGNRHYITEVTADTVEFGESSASQARMGAGERVTTPMSTPPAKAIGFPQSKRKQGSRETEGFVGRRSNAGGDEQQRKAWL